MIISDFTKPELLLLEEQCNFTEEEMTLFELRSKGYTVEECAEKLNLSVSGLKKRNQKLNSKINKVLSMY